jgi:hypothetical protein
MDFIQIKKVVTDFISENFRNPGKIVKLQKDEDKWVSKIEVIEESEYVRKFGKTDIVGLYELEISLSGDVLGFKRLLLRERSDLNSNE